MAAADRQARFEAVFNTVYEPLQRYFGRRAMADDVPELLNDALVVIWRRLDDVPPDEPLAWSYGVARRCLANHRRGDARRLRLVGRLAADPQGRHRETGSAMAADDHAELHLALGGLDESERELVRLWAWEQLVPREIAVVLDTTPNAVSLRLTRAKRKLAASLERSRGGEPRRQSGALAGHQRFRHGREHGT